MNTLLSVLSILLLACLTSGLPTQNQTVNNNGSSRNASFSTDDDDAVVIRKERTRTGMLTDFIIERMVVQCDGDIDPAVQFYGCVENTTNLPMVWAMMGLNATLMRLRTVDTYLFLAQSGNVTKDQNTFVSVLQDAPQSSNNTLMDIFSNIGKQADKLCGNVDGLLACLNPYLDACFPDSDADNSLLKQQQTGAIATPITPSTPASGSNDSDEDDLFFLIPYLATQAQVFPLLQQAFAIVCSNQAVPLKGLIDNMPCLFQSVDQASTSCATVCLAPTPSVNSTSSNGEPASAVPDGTALDPVICSIMRDCAECQLDMAAQTCGQDLAVLLHALVQTYFNALQCFPNSNVNENSVRNPFNVGIL